MATITLRVPDELDEALERQSNAAGVSPGTINYLREHRAELRQRRDPGPLDSVARKCGTSRPRGTSLRHREYRLLPGTALHSIVARGFRPLRQARWRREGLRQWQ